MSTSSLQVRPWRMISLAVATLAAAAVLAPAVTPANAGVRAADRQSGRTALASSAAPDWTQQAPATSPPAKFGSTMAYDAATGTAVLFTDRHFSAAGETWTWDGSTWTQQTPATSPHRRHAAAMAYDAATHTVVLFSGLVDYRDTWTWDGSNWTKQAPATRPPGREGASMAYDAATGTIVLFGGINFSGRGLLRDTWTWDGSTWTKQAPATRPPARQGASMAYDAATGTIVLFGGTGGPHGKRLFGDTWTWDGSTWTKQAPAASPSARQGASMAYDAATGNIVLFGGFGQSPSGNTFLGDTWTWDGSTWTQQAPTTSPPVRSGAPMAYDAATGTTVLFGGFNFTTGTLNDTWTWGSSGK